MDFNNTNQQNQNSNQNNNQNGNPYGNPFPGQQPNPYYVPVEKSPTDALATAAMILGILAVLSAIMSTVYPPFIFGGISIVLALLSKGYKDKMSGKAKTGIVCAIVGLVMNIWIVGSVYYILFTNEDAFNYFDSVYEQMYGDSFSDMYEEITGEEFWFD